MMLCIRSILSQRYRLPCDQIYHVQNKAACRMAVSHLLDPFNMTLGECLSTHTRMAPEEVVVRHTQHMNQQRKIYTKGQILNLLVGVNMTKTVLDRSTIKLGSINLNFLTNLRNDVSFNNTQTNRTQQPNRRQPIFYVDTNIMMDANKERNLHSISLINIIDKHKWECITSAFAFMEMIDIEQDDEFVKTEHRAGVDYSKICRNRYCRNMPCMCSPD